MFSTPEDVIIVLLGSEFCVPKTDLFYYVVNSRSLSNSLNSVSQAGICQIFFFNIIQSVGVLLELFFCFQCQYTFSPTIFISYDYFKKTLIGMMKDDSLQFVLNILNE